MRFYVFFRVFGRLDRWLNKAAVRTYSRLSMEDHHLGSLSRPQPPIRLPVHVDPQVQKPSKNNFLKVKVENRARAKSYVKAFMELGEQSN